MLGKRRGKGSNVTKFGEASGQVGANPPKRGLGLFGILGWVLALGSTGGAVFLLFTMYPASAYQELLYAYESNIKALNGADAKLELFESERSKVIKQIKDANKASVKMAEERDQYYKNWKDTSAQLTAAKNDLADAYASSDAQYQEYLKALDKANEQIDIANSTIAKAAQALETERSNSTALQTLLSQQASAVEELANAPDLNEEQVCETPKVTQTQTSESYQLLLNKIEEFEKREKALVAKYNELNVRHQQYIAETKNKVQGTFDWELDLQRQREDERFYEELLEEDESDAGQYLKELFKNTDFANNRQSSFIEGAEYQTASNETTESDAIEFRTKRSKEGNYSYALAIVDKEKRRLAKSLCSPNVHD